MPLGLSNLGLGLSQRGGGGGIASYAINGILPDVVFDPVKSFYFGDGRSLKISDLMDWNGVNITNTGALRVASNTLSLGVLAENLDISAGFTIAIDGYLTYVKENNVQQLTLYEARTGATYCRTVLQTHSILTGRFAASITNIGSSFGDGAAQISPGTNVPFSVAARHTVGGDTRIAAQGVLGNLGTGGTYPTFAGTETITIALSPAAFDGQEATITRIRMWSGDALGDDNLTDASELYTVPGWTRPAERKLIMYGDSLTQSGYQSTIHDLLPTHVDINQGRGSTATRHIAARMGAITVDMTVSGAEIVSGANTITHINGYALGPGINGVSDATDNQFLSRGDSPTSDSLTGTLGGVHGTLVRTVGGAGVVNVDDEVYTFTPDAGETLPVALVGDATWQTDDLYRGEDNIFVVWTGSNDLGFGNVATRFDTYATAIATFLSDEKYILAGPITRTGDAQTDWHDGGSFYNEMIYANGVASSLAGANYLSLQDFLVNDGLAYAGVTATAQDLTDISRKTPPSSLKSDFIHNNADGNRAIGIRIFERARELI